MLQLMGILRMEYRWHKAFLGLMGVGARCHMVQIVNMNVNRVANRNLTFWLELAISAGFGMHIIVMCVVWWHLGHMIKMVVRNNDHGHLAMSIRVRKSDDWVSYGSGVPRILGLCSP